MRPWLDHVLARIDAAPLSYKPWRNLHVKVPGVFPADFYAELLRQLPAYERCEITEKPWRHFYFRSTANDPFWVDVFDKLIGPAMIATLTRKFGVAGSSGDACLMRDKPGNVLGPHTDMGPKTLTGLFYLPETDAGAAYGTSLLVSRSGRTDDGSRDYDFSDDFWHADLIPYLPNTAFFFAKTDKSWHAAKQTDICRDLINIEINP